MTRVPDWDGQGLPPAFLRLAGELEKRLAGPLPGSTAQLKMAPVLRRAWSPDTDPSAWRDGAALLLLSPEPAGPAVILTVRTETVLHHRSQVSLPGGAVEPGEKLEEAALREAREEIGLDTALVRIIGCLTPLHIPVSGFLLHPFVGIARRSPALQRDPREVARILRVPLACLGDPGRMGVGTRKHGHVAYRYPFYAVEGEQVWGATAMVLAEFLDLIPRPGGIHQGGE